MKWKGFHKLLEQHNKKEVKENDVFIETKLVDTDDSINFCYNDVYLFN